MKLDIVHAENSEGMEKLSETFLENKFKINQSDNNFILMKKRRYGNYYVHILFLLIALFVFDYAIFVNVVYFAYSYLWRSPLVLITTEVNGEDGEPLEFSNIDDILEKANALF
ncbi:MAG: hypothetical protein MJ209_04805 [archaeon]|nr:hypothetical protein [archaeon]